MPIVPRLLLPAVLASTVAAQATWSQLYPLGYTPAARTSPTFGMHERLGRAFVMFGFTAPSGIQLNSMEVFAGTAWTTPSGPLPPWRGEAMVAFDAVRDEVVLFGGNSASGTLLDDTWVWNGATWSPRPSAVRPAPRYGAGMAFDFARGVTVLFGGIGAPTPTFFGDTWQWNGTQWQQQPTVGAPAPRAYASMAFDPVSQRVLLHGGWNSAAGSGAIFNDTWSYAADGWLREFPATPPPFRLFPGMVSDRFRERVILLGGNGGDGFAWEWDGDQWHLRLQPTPAPRQSFAIGYDDALKRVVVHGGVLALYPNVYYLADTWQFYSSLPANVSSFGSGCGGTLGAPVLRSVPFALPWLGSAVRTVVEPIPAGQAGAVFVSSLATAPPVSLAAVGMPGCELLVPGDVVEFVPNGGGFASWQLSLPGSSSLAGFPFWQQAFVFDAAANPLGLVASNGLILTPGIR